MTQYTANYTVLLPISNYSVSVKLITWKKIHTHNKKCIQETLRTFKSKTRADSGYTSQDKSDMTPALTELTRY